MWGLYIIMALLAAGTCTKLLQPLLAGPAGTPRDRQTLYTAVCLVPVAALCLYLFLGRPDLPGAPAIFGGVSDPATLVQGLDDLMSRQQALLMRHPAQVLLEENPDNLAAIVQLASVQVKLHNYKDAIKFYQRAVIIAEEKKDPFLRIYATNLGELQVEADAGNVNDAAIGTFNYVLTLQAGNPLARHYLALGKYQRGDIQGAITDWQSLLSDGPPGAYWKDMVRSSLAKAQEKLRARK